MDDRLAKIDSAISTLIKAVESKQLRPGRSWSISLNALWKKREELEESLSETTGKPHP